MMSQFPLFHFSGSVGDLQIDSHTTTHTSTDTVSIGRTQRTTTKTSSEITINGKNGYLIGFATNKGLFLAIYNGKTCVILGKDGVSRCVHKEFSRATTAEKITNLFSARCLGLLDTIQFTISAPFFLTAHGITFVGSAIGTIVTFPALLLPNPKGKLIWKTCALSTWENLGSLVSISTNLVLTPIEIIAPELNIKVLKMQKWGTKFPEAEGRRS